MKQLDPITVGEFTVQIVAEPMEQPAHGIRFDAVCGLTKMSNRMTMQVSHNHSQEQFDRDIAAHAERLAVEVAGLERARVLKEKFFG